MGVWHTHPQQIPVPSDIDWADWKDSLKEEKSGCEYIFFVIIGIKEWRVWIGDIKNGTICEIFECDKDKDGLYFCQKNEE